MTPAINERYELRLSLKEVLRQVAESMAQEHIDISVTLPTFTAWRTALRAVDAALGEANADEQMMFEKERSETTRRILRDLAREEAKRLNSLAENTSVAAPPALPIRSEVDLKSVGPP